MFCIVKFDARTELVIAVDIAKLLGVRVAVIRDNDGDYQRICVENYSEHIMSNAKIFADTDSESRTTFEICLYNDNKMLCDELFGASRRNLDVLEYMLANKADAAFELLLKKQADLVVPVYIQEAIEWINE